MMNLDRRKWLLQLLVAQLVYAAPSSTVTYSNITATPTHSFPFSEITFYNFLYTAITDASLRHFCESAYLQSSLDLPRVTSTWSIANDDSTIFETITNVKSGSTIKAQPPCCGECSISGFPAELRYFPSASSNSSAVASTAVFDGFTYTSPSVYLVLSSVEATDLCGAVGSQATQKVTLSFPPNYLYTYSGYIGNLGATNSGPSALFKPTDLNNCTTAHTSVDVGPHFADNCSPFIVAPSQLLDVDPAWSTCTRVALGFHDPPRSLTPVAGFAPASVTAQPASAPPSVTPDPTNPATKINGLPGLLPDIDPQASSKSDDPAVPESSSAALSEPDPPSSATVDPDSSVSNVKPQPVPSVEPSAGTSNDDGSSVQPQPTIPVSSPQPAAESTSSGESNPQATDQPVASKVKPQHPSVLPVLGQTFTAKAGSVLEAPSATLKPGAPAITISSTPVSLASAADYIVIGSSTQFIPAGVTAAPAVLQLGKTPITANPASQFIIGSQTLTRGGTITVSGTRVVLPPSGSHAIIGSSTFALGAAHEFPKKVLTIGDQTYTADPTNAKNFVIQDQTLTPGGAITISGTRISLPTSGSYAIIGSSTVPFSTTTTSPTFPKKILTIGAQTYTADPKNPQDFIIQGQTLTPGGSLTISGTRISLPTSGSYAIVGSTTIPLNTAPSNPPGMKTLTLGNSIYTANPSGEFVIGSETLSQGAEVTVSGTRVSLAPGDTEAVVGTRTEGLGDQIMAPFTGTVTPFEGGGTGIRQRLNCCWMLTMILIFFTM